MAGFTWIRWPLSPGIGGSFRRNTHTDGATVIATGTFSGDCAGYLFYAVGGSYLRGQFAVSGNVNQAFVVTAGSTLYADSLSFTGTATGSCVYVSHGSYAQLNSATISGTCVEGVTVNNARAVCYATTISGATSIAVECRYQSYCGFVNGSSVSGTPSIGIRARQSSYVYAPGSTVTGATTDYSPAVNTEGNVLSYIAK